MATSIQPSSDGKYILLKLSGDVTNQSMIENIASSHAMGLELDIHNYLVDATEARNAQSATANYGFAYKDSNDMRDAPNFDSFARVAILVRPDDHSHDFPVTVLRNNAFNVMLFRDRQAAIDHLTRES